MLEKKNRRGPRSHRPCAHPRLLPFEGLEMPENERLAAEDHAETLDIAVAHKLPRDQSRDCAADEPPKRQPPRIVETDDQLGAAEWQVLPLAVGGVEHPRFAGHHRRNPAALLLIGNADPS